MAEGSFKAEISDKGIELVMGKVSRVIMVVNASMNIRLTVVLASGF